MVPVGAESFREGLRWCAEITHTLGAQLKEKGLSAGVGDEGGFAPDLRSDEEAIEEVLTAIEKAGYTGKVKLALDAAASEWVQGDRYVLPKRGKVCAPEELIAYWEELVGKNRYTYRGRRTGRAGRSSPCGWATRYSWWGTTCSSPTRTGCGRASTRGRPTPSSSSPTRSAP